MTTQNTITNSRNINFIQHNCRSAANKWSQIINYLNINRISIALLSETFNLDDRRITLPSNYQIVHRARPDRNGGGVAILVHESLKFETVQLQVPAPIEIVAIKTLNTKPNITVFSVYIPPENRTIRMNPRIMESLINLNMDHQASIMGGDFNAHSPLWSNNNLECRRGKLLREILEDTDLVLMNEGEITLEGPANRESSTLDLTLVSPNIARTLQWEVTEETLGSDHLIIRYKLADVWFNRAEPKRRFNTFDRSIFQTEIKQVLESQQTPPQTLNDIMNIIDEAGELSIKRCKTYRGRFIPKPWWNEKIKRLYEAKRLTKRYHRTNPTPSNQDALNEATRRLRRAINESKEEAWERFIADISPGNMSATYNKIRILKGQANGKTRQSIVKQGITNASNFLQTVCEPSSKYVSNIQTPPIITNVEVNMEALNGPFSRSEFESTIYGKRGSAPGLDEINFRMLQALPSTMKNILLVSMNTLFQTYEYPNDWRLIEIIPVPKPGKDPNLISSSRPIALLSCPAKIMLTMVKLRLEYYIEKTGILSPNCIGFRRGRSSTTAVNILVSDVRQAFEQKMYTFAAFIDIENAYTQVNPHLLIKILRSEGVPNTIVEWIQSYIQCRTYVIKTEEGPTFHESKWGILQGCPLSPTLFNVYCTLLHQTELFNCKLVQYADDLALYCSHKRFDVALENLQRGIQSLQGTLKELNFTINPHKSSIMPLTRRRYNPEAIIVEIDRQSLPVTTVHKFLGMWLDSKLKLSTHIAEINKKNYKGNQYNQKLVRGEWRPSSKHGNS